MSESMYGYAFLLLGIFAGALLLFFGTVNTKDENEYYSLKEVTQNAMLDSVDKVAYQVGLTQDEIDKIGNTKIQCDSGVSGTVRIISEKFVENFARRYAEVAKDNNTYTVRIYEINECPPKVSLRIDSVENYSFLRRIFNGERKSNEDMIVVNRLSAILETKD